MKLGQNVCLDKRWVWKWFIFCQKLGHGDQIMKNLLYPRGCDLNPSYLTLYHTIRKAQVSDSRAIMALLFLLSTCLKFGLNMDIFSMFRTMLTTFVTTDDCQTKHWEVAMVGQSNLLLELSLTTDPSCQEFTGCLLITTWIVPKKNSAVWSLLTELWVKSKYRPSRCTSNTQNIWQAIISKLKFQDVQFGLIH